MRERDEAVALDIIGITESCLVRPLDTRIALSAADLSVRYKLAMADAVVYASAIAADAQLYTSDAHFAGLLGVCFWQKMA